MRTIRNTTRGLCLLLMLAAVLLTGCVKNPAPKPVGADVSMGVAGFTQPVHTSELLAGFIPENQKLVDNEVLYALDKEFTSQLRETGRRPFQGTATTRQCQEIVTFEEKGARGAALNYWIKVGKCLPVDYLLVPQLITWRERQGEEGSITPASVTVDVYVIDVQEGQLLSRYHFDETQVSLSENLLELKKFLTRSGKWVSASELAAEGLRQGIKELGL